MSVNSRIKSISKLGCLGKSIHERHADTSFFRCSKNFEYVIPEERSPAILNQRIGVQYYYTTTNFSCIAWPSLVEQLDRCPYQVYVS